MSSRSTRGFTTLELIIVGLLATVLFAIAVPGVQRSVGATRLQTSANELYTELNYARSLSVSRNTAYVLSIDRANRAFRLQDNLSEQAPRSTRTLEQGIFFSRLPEAPITFFPRGHAEGGAIVLSNGFGGFVRLDVRPSGMVEMHTYEAQAK